MAEMSIALHVGAPQTDDEQLTWSLRKDALALLDRGVLVRRPGLYRKALAQMLERQANGYVPPEEKAEFLAGIVKGQKATRLVISEPHALGAPAWSLNGGRLFQNAGRNAGELRDLFPSCDCEFFLGLRNPATLIPAVFTGQTEKGWDDFLSGADLLSLRWSEVVADILEENPGARVVVWCNEETPLIWARVLRRITALDASFAFSGELDIIGQIMPPLGISRLEEYLAERPHLSETQKTQVKAMFIERLHSEDAIEEEIDLPGWSQEIVDAMTETYADDVEAIRVMDGVSFIG